MEIVNEFELRLAPDDALELLLDLERVTSCLPGAELGELHDDGECALTMSVRLGPMRFLYDGSIRVTETDRTQRRAVLVGRARERRNQGDAKATITMEVAQDGEYSAVRAVADVQLTGRAAQNGRGIVQDVSRRLIAQFAQTLDQRYGGQADAP